MKKLLLEEDEVIVEPVADNDQIISNLITQMIQQEWQAIDFYNSVQITLQAYNSSKVEPVINDIITQHYTSIGQLENLLQNFDSGAELIDNEDIES